jgi:hypothetical protein
LADRFSRLARHEPAERVIEHLHDLDLITRCHQIVGELAADESRPKDYDSVSIGDSLAEARVVVEVIYRMRRIGIAGNSESHGIGAESEHQPTVCERVSVEMQLTDISVDCIDACTRANTCAEIRRHLGGIGGGQIIGFE